MTEREIEVIARLAETSEIPLADARGRKLAEIVTLAEKGRNKTRSS